MGEQIETLTQKLNEDCGNRFYNPVKITRAGNCATFIWTFPALAQS
jgi:hypothetical protein